MKSQDILLLLKLVSLEKQVKKIPFYLESKWTDWDDLGDFEGRQAQLHFDDVENSVKWSESSLRDDFYMQYSVRSLEESTGISKSEVSMALKRCIDSGLAKQGFIAGELIINIAALQNLIIYALKYVFQVKPAQITRGIATAWAAPVLNKHILSAGDFIPVWTDARGQTKGMAIAPLFKSVPYAIRRDPRLYAYLALVDAIRIGQPRESKVATEMLIELLRE